MLTILQTQASDFMFIIPTIPHLRDVKLTMSYRELPESETQLKWTPTQKWKSDPDASRFHGFAPSNKQFINGKLVSERKPGLCAVSRSPFPEKRVPRRGLVEVSPDDPDYKRICKEQGISDPTTTESSPLLPNGVHSSSPVSSSSRVNGLPPDQTPSSIPVTNGTGNLQGHDTNQISLNSEPRPAQAPTLVNGDHSITNGDGQSVH